jgi:hypothetical protein
MTARLFLLLAVVLCTASLCVAVFSSSPSGGGVSIQSSAPFLALDESDRDLGQIPPGNHIVSIPITNACDKAKYLLGVNQSCTKNCCYGPKLKYMGPVSIQPGSIYLLEFEVHVNGPGPFIAPIRFYLEDREIRLVELLVKGIGAVSGEKLTDPASLPKH